MKMSNSQMTIVSVFTLKSKYSIYMQNCEKANLIFGSVE